MASSPLSLPLYYEGLSLADMERKLRDGYLTQSGWLESAESKLATRLGQPIPWFTYSAISFLERELTPDLAMFEYGGGQSSLYWANRLRKLVSVDHDPAFGSLIRPMLPAHATFQIVAENAPLSDRLAHLMTELPTFADPGRTIQTYRSGQLNLDFRSYGLQILEYPSNSFDVVVINGMARNLSTWAAIRHFQRNGFIIFDNSDRDFYRDAYHLLEEAGYRRIDFRGIGPINPYEWCTSVFYQHRFFSGSRWFADKGSEAATEREELKQSNELGILVLAYNRPWHLQSVLESLRQQRQLGTTHLWIDGNQGRAELQDRTRATADIARRYPVRELRLHRSHLGIEKMMLDALDDMSQRYDRVLVLEDDCFPLEGGINDFEKGLEDIIDSPDIYSIYGHHFGLEPTESLDFTRFQGWGWAAHSDRIRMLLPKLKALFAMDEESYCAHIAAEMTDDICARLDVTPGRDVLRVLEKFFSWDSATAFLTAQYGLSHRRTARPAVQHTGISPGTGHLSSDIPRLRAPPFNMVTIDEAWGHYDRTTPPCDGQKNSYGLDGLDLKLLAALEGEAPGVFVELGAHDGVTQSNSILLEQRGWTGLLIEASPSSYARCKKARPGVIVEHSACVSANFKGSQITLTDVGLMSLTNRSGIDGDARASWVERGEGFAPLPRQDIEVPTATLSSILDRHRIGAPDLLLLDVEGAEIDVLEGLDFTRHGPRFILAEDAYTEEIAAYLQTFGYVRKTILLERKFTRDCLYEKV